MISTFLRFIKGIFLVFFLYPAGFVNAAGRRNLYKILLYKYLQSKDIRFPRRKKMCINAAFV
jgi:hypothetical protein